MHIGLNDIDPQISEQIADRLNAPMNEFLRDDVHWGGWFPFQVQWQKPQVNPQKSGSNWEVKLGGGPRLMRKRDPNPDERAAFEVRQKREEHFVLRCVNAALLPLLAGGALAFTANLGLGLSENASLGTFVASWLGGTGAGTWWASRAVPSRRLRQSVLLPEWKAVLPLLRLNRVERIYCDVVLLLARTESDPATETTLRDTLAQLNNLLRSYRQLETKRQALLGVMGAHNVQEIEDEYGNLGRKLDATTDPVIRQSLEQSLRMCAARLENAKNLGQGLERLNSQQEAIQQALAAALSTMARMQVAAPAQTTLAAEQITETVSEMRQQAYAVEQAVEEVMQIRLQ